jgi:hypothetical protein
LDVIKKTKFSGAFHYPVVRCSPRKSFANELRILVAAFSINRTPSSLGRVKTLLEQADPDLLQYNNTAINSFRCADDDETTFEISEAEEVVNEALKLWPDLANKNISAEKVLIMRSALSRLGKEVEYFYVRGVIALGSARLRNTGLETLEMDEIDGIVGDVVESIELVVGKVTPEQRSSIEISAYAVLVSAFLAKLKEIQAAALANINDVKKAFGDQTMDGTLPEIVQSYATSLDMGFAKHLFDEGMRIVAGELSSRTSNVLLDPVEELIEILKELEVSKASGSYATIRSSFKGSSSSIHHGGFSTGSDSFQRITHSQEYRMFAGIAESYE